MILGERVVLGPRWNRCVVHMGGGDAFTIWVGLARMHRIWLHAIRRNRFISIEGSRRYALNPHQIVMVEGR